MERSIASVTMKTAVSNPMVTSVPKHRCQICLRYTNQRNTLFGHLICCAEVRHRQLQPIPRYSSVLRTCLIVLISSGFSFGLFREVPGSFLLLRLSGYGMICQRGIVFDEALPPVSDSDNLIFFCDPATHNCPYSSIETRTISAVITPIAPVIIILKCYWYRPSSGGYNDILYGVID